mmetsp:Transcript_23500/g.46771  ORF Transcript_23500/g.46771 Transcript_23500/m.46771 type:complete len:135 (+) Transcript_23500:1390-1794(+)
MCRKAPSVLRDRWSTPVAVITVSASSEASEKPPPPLDLRRFDTDDEVDDNLREDEELDFGGVVKVGVGRGRNATVRTTKRGHSTGKELVTKLHACLGAASAMAWCSSAKWRWRAETEASVVRCGDWGDADWCPG